MILLDKMRQVMPEFARGMDGMSPSPTVLRVHKDVTDLALELVASDSEKLTMGMKEAFWPAESCWFEWEMGPGTDFQPGGVMGVMFGGGDVRAGNGVYYSWKHGQPTLHTAVPFVFDAEEETFDADLTKMDYTDPMRMAVAWNSGIRPVILALLALLNSPKIVKRAPAKLDKLNRKREAAGKYTYHPHHTVRINIDRKTVRVGDTGGGDGASRALHMVRAHLRLWEGRYILVRPHWRGDPVIGIRNTSYEMDRSGSRWAE